VAESRKVNATKETPLGPGAAVKAPKSLIWKEVGTVQGRSVARGVIGVLRTTGRRARRVVTRKYIFAVVVGNVRTVDWID